MYVAVTKSSHLKEALLAGMWGSQGFWLFIWPADGIHETLLFSLCLQDSQGIGNVIL